MAALFDDAAIFHDNDPVGAPDGREPVRNDERGAPLGSRRNGLLDETFTFTVEGRGCLIQQQDRRAADKGASEGDALALAA